MAKSSKRLRSTSRLLALEPRLLFDGAAMVAAQDAMPPDDVHQDNAGHASDASLEGRSPQPLDFDGSRADTAPQEVVLIDSRVPQYQDLAAQAQANGAQVHIVNVSESGLTAISNTLVQAGNVGSLQVIALDAGGTSQLGSDSVTQAQLQERLSQDAGWSYYVSGDSAQVDFQALEASIDNSDVPP
uniref:DUF4347 domain-containing protein n=1 Tax=Pantoea sp. 18069 TaxID=2681415 RepID=UPI0013587409